MLGSALEAAALAVILVMILAAPVTATVVITLRKAGEAREGLSPAAPGTDSGPA